MSMLFFLMATNIRGCGAFQNQLSVVLLFILSEKLFHTTGVENGLLSGTCKAFGRIQKGTSVYGFSANTIIQYAYAEFMKDAKNYSGIEKFYQRKETTF